MHDRPESVGKTAADIETEKFSTSAPTAGRKWVSPSIETLPRLSELTLQSGTPIPGGGGPGGGGTTVIP